MVPPGLRVLEIGCGSGDLLAALQPALGVGVEFTRRMACLAQRLHPDLLIVLADAHALSLSGPFDVVILSDLVNDLWDVQTALVEVHRVCGPHTRVILNYYSRLWEIPLGITAKLGLAKPTLYQNWLTREDVTNLLYIAGFEVIREWPEVLFPLPVPLLDSFFNRFLGRLWPFSAFSLSNFTIARPAPRPDLHPEGVRVSVIVPARNEAGNVPEIFARVPEMGAGTELIFVEGHSRDDTYATIESEMKRHPEQECRLLRQTGQGKGDAVRLGFSQAAGDVLMILDADLTVPPEDLPRFYEALVSGKGEFINGVRLVYPMEGNAMRFLNLIGNKSFSIVFTWLLGQPTRYSLRDEGAVKPVCAHRDEPGVFWGFRSVWGF
jgi:SAM-dependent methyltransferase